MALKIGDRVRENTSSTGVGGLSLTGAPAGFQRFSAILASGDVTYYSLEENDKFEVGIGTVTDATPDTLSRDTVISNNLGTTNEIDFGAGAKEVFCTIPAKKAMSPVMEATGYVVTHASTLDEDQTLDSGVLAGPVTITGTQTITGTLVII